MDTFWKTTKELDLPKNSMDSEEGNLLEKIAANKQEILDYLDNFLEEWEKEDEAFEWREDVSSRLKEMVKGGKMVRGSLVIITNRLYNGENKEDCLRTAAAIELLHTGILMHDDIIDKDDYRRGMKTFQRQYRELGEEKNIKEPDHYGMSMGMAGGDISFFLGQNLISKIDSSPEKRKNVQELVFREFADVGLAEQVDIHAGYSEERLSQEDILDLYRRKTARYTFSLPLKAGAILAGASKEEQEKLYSIGEKIGSIFQLKDDELGLFGDQEKTGEEIGSDLDEDKKTVHRLKLLEKLSDKEEERVRGLLGSDLSKDERSEITELMEEKNVKEDVREIMEIMSEEVFEMVEQLEVENEGKEFLRNATKFCLNREK